MNAPAELDVDVSVVRGPVGNVKSRSAVEVHRLCHIGDGEMDTHERCVIAAALGHERICPLWRSYASGADRDKERTRHTSIRGAPDVLADARKHPAAQGAGGLAFEPKLDGWR